MFQLGQPVAPYLGAGVLPLPPTGLHRVSAIKRDRILSNKNYYPLIVPILEEKVDRIRLTDDQIKEFNNLALQLNSGSMTLEDTILEMRAGGFYDWATLAFIIIFGIFP